MMLRLPRDAELVKHIIDFYKDLLGPPEVSYVKIEGLEGNKLSEEGTTFLTREFDTEEFKEVVFGMKHNKAPGPDGLITFRVLLETLGRCEV